MERKRNKLPMFSNILSHTKCSSGNIIINLVNKIHFVYISILLLKDTESNKLLNYCRQVRNSQTMTDALVLRKQSTGETELMGVAQTFQKPKRL